MKLETANNLLSLVKRNYNEIALEFDATRKKALWPEMEYWADQVSDGDKILDAGCGNGRLLEALKNKPIEYLGIDNSEELIKLARQNYPNQKFAMADILDLSAVPDQAFNYVFCLAVLQHLPGRELRVKALKQLAAKLKPAGHLVISVWNLWSSQKHRPLLFRTYWLKILGQSELDYGDLLFPWKGANGHIVSERYYHAFSKRELRKLARLAGLGIKKINKDKYNYWCILDNSQ